MYDTYIPLVHGGGDVFEKVSRRCKCSLEVSNALSVGMCFRCWRVSLGWTDGCVILWSHLSARAPNQADVYPQALLYWYIDSMRDTLLQHCLAILACTKQSQGAVTERMRPKWLQTSLGAFLAGTRARILTTSLMNSTIRVGLRNDGSMEVQASRKEQSYH